jgi:hypothetical protein
LTAQRTEGADGKSKANVLLNAIEDFAEGKGKGAGPV